MNRRKKKKQQINYSELFKAKLDSFDWQAFTHTIKHQWQQLPKFHQRALMLLTPLLVLLFVIPMPTSTIEKNSETATERVS